MRICHVCVVSNDKVSDISRKVYNGRSLLTIFKECTNVSTSSCNLCSLCEKGLKFTYNFKRKALSSNQLLTTEVKLEKEPAVKIEPEDEKILSVCDQLSQSLSQRCRYCLQPFDRRKIRLQHEHLHLQENHGLECHFCHKKYPKTELVKHIKRTHWRNPTIRYYCEKCPKNFSAQSGLSTHRKQEHSNKIAAEEPVTCFHCNKKFARKNLLKIHIREVHRQPPDVTCFYCERRYKNKKILKLHIISVHLKLKMYECRICQKKFSTASYRINHMSEYKISK